MRVFDPREFDRLLTAYGVAATSARLSGPKSLRPLAYTAATGAALALAPSADAAIQYANPTDILLDLRSPTSATQALETKININANSLFPTHSLADALFDFSFKLYLTSNIYRTASVGNFAGLMGAGIVAASDGNAARLNAGDLISNTSTANLMRAATTADTNPQGHWLGGTMSVGAAHFLGVVFNIPNGSVTSRHFGWIRVGIETNNFGQPVAMTIYDWAWETESDLPVMAGSLTSIPEPSPSAGLALLAAGAAGVAAWRRRKQGASEHKNP